jgi:hypothetical protein
MSTAARADWQSENQAHLVAALARIKAILRRHAEKGGRGEEGKNGREEAETEDVAQDSKSAHGPTGPDSCPSRHAALDALCEAFSLSAFERDIVLLCAGNELDSSFAPLCAAAQGDPSRTYPTFSLALAALPCAHRSALSPVGPLRRWRLIEIGTGPALTISPLRLDEHVLHYLAGTPHLDERLAELVEPVEPPMDEDLAASHAAVARQVVAAWSAARGRCETPLILLCGPDPGDRRAVAAAAGIALGLRTAALPADLIPAGAGELDALVHLWEREAALGGVALLVECDGLAGTRSGAAPQPDTARSRGALRFVARIAGPVIVSDRERPDISQRRVMYFDLSRSTSAEQRAVWRKALGAASDADLEGVDAVVGQFTLSLAAIRSAAAEVLARRSAGKESDVGRIAWDVCRRLSRTRLEDLAERIDSTVGWDDLVLPGPPGDAVRRIGLHVRHRATVYDDWGFAAASPRGLGIGALFAGPSGTGKTMAAEVLANELRLDLYRIDLAGVVSKYIGETEKNLRRIFDAAEDGGAVLLFDEADALFGKRSEIKDSHDRFANIEVSYLLQRMEAYRGLAILTTNLKSALDPAFLRRIRFVVQFPFPEAAQRAEIWRRIFPPSVPTEKLDMAKLARLNVAGGNIRNIALNAAFPAADAGGPVRMSHLLQAAKEEYTKLEWPMTDAEIGGWV